MGVKLSVFSQIRQLEYPNNLIFALLMCRRQFNHFQLWAEQVGGVIYLEDGQELPLTDGIKLAANIESLLFEKLKQPSSKIDLAKKMAKFECFIPSILDDIGSHFAVDYGMSLLAALGILSGDDPDGAVVCAKLAQGGVERYLLEVCAIPETAVKAHELMQHEIGVQAELAAELGSRRLGANGIDHWRQQWKDISCSTIGLELD